jgi:hypothetical protein
MRFIARLFPSQDVREALQVITKIEQSLPNELWAQLGFGVIKTNLRRRITDKPEELRAAARPSRFPMRSTWRRQSSTASMNSIHSMKRAVPSR